MVRIVEYFKRFWFWSRSFFKRTWEFEDYPLRVRAQDTVKDPEVYPYQAQILGWWLSGGGETREEAITGCRKMFDNARKKRARLPRPGVNVPIQYSSKVRLNRVPKGLVEDFTVHVLQLPWVFITDGSRLTDFTTRPDNIEYASRIQERFGVDVSLLPDNHLVTILEAIMQKRVQAPGNSIGT